jgi:type I restriction enzyme R subunit
VITDAIKDENVLKFSVEYVGRYRQKDESKTNIDILMNILIVVTLVSEYDTVGCDFVLKERINQF